MNSNTIHRHLKKSYDTEMRRHNNRVLWQTKDRNICLVHRRNRWQSHITQFLKKIFGQKRYVALLEPVPVANRSIFCWNFELHESQFAPTKTWMLILIYDRLFVFFHTYDFAFIHANVLLGSWKSLPCIWINKDIHTCTYIYILGWKWSHIVFRTVSV